MKVLVIGTGSIGTRHAKNIAEFGHDVYAVDINKRNLRAVAPFVKGTFTSLSEALRIQPDAAFICTYSNDHIAPAIACAEARCHLFVEKPLSVTFDGIDRLIEIVRKKRLISMVGCNMRFHPAISHIYDTLRNNPACSKPLWANLEFGYYLPFAKRNYESSYMAKRSMGGNMIFDVIHELDYAIWFFGEPLEVFCVKGILSSLKIDTEDAVDMMIRFKSGVRCNVHMDYLQHGYSRRCKIVSERATTVWDFNSGEIRMTSDDKKQRVWKDIPSEIYYNQMYLDEIKYFFDCVSSSKDSFNSIPQSTSVLKLALSAEKSSHTNMWERI